MARGKPMKTPENLARAQQMRAEGKLLREIADEIGVAVQTINSWLNDPGGRKAKARRDSYCGRCSCGRPTTGCNGRNAAPDICRRCYEVRLTERNAEMARLYDERVPIAEIARRFGAEPRAAYAAARAGGAKYRYLSGTMSERRARREAAVAMAAAGKSPAAIAEALGYASADSAKFAVYSERRKSPSDMGARGASLPSMPAPIERLSRDARGYPVPWFVAYVDGEPHFPTMDEGKLLRAARHERCWICGGPLERERAYVVGPMCVINRTSGEPPSHRECATFAAVACPFLVNPRRRRRPRIEGQVEAGGIPVYRNPGVAVVWTTEGTRVRPDGCGGILFDIGEPARRVRWYTHGRDATRAEAEESLDGGHELLREVAAQDGAGALLELSRLAAGARRYLPVEAAQNSRKWREFPQVEASR